MRLRRPPTLLLLLAALSLGGAPQDSASALRTDGRPMRSEIFHPATGQCVVNRRLVDSLELGPCTGTPSWSYTPQRLLTVGGTYYCLQATGAGRPARLSIICDAAESQWTVVEYSTGGMTRMLTSLPDGAELCLDVGSDGVVVANPCNGAGATQWFELVKDDEPDN